MIQRIIDGLDRCVRESNTSKVLIDRVVLAGGSAQVPLVKDAITMWIGEESKVYSCDSAQLAAKGATFMAASLVGHFKHEFQMTNIEITRNDELYSTYRQ